MIENFDLSLSINSEWAESTINGLIYHFSPNINVIGMTVILDLDDRGRVTIPKEWRERFRIKRTVAIQSKQGILLIPISSDPIKALKGSFTLEKSVRELKAQADNLLQQEK